MRRSIVPARESATLSKSVGQIKSDVSLLEDHPRAHGLVTVPTPEETRQQTIDLLARLPSGPTSTSGAHRRHRVLPARFGVRRGAGLRRAFESDARCPCSWPRGPHVGRRAWRRRVRILGGESGPSPSPTPAETSNATAAAESGGSRGRRHCCTSPAFHPCPCRRVVSPSSPTRWPRISSEATPPRDHATGILASPSFGPPRRLNHRLRQRSGFGEDHDCGGAPRPKPSSSNGGAVLLLTRRSGLKRPLPTRSVSRRREHRTARARSAASSDGGRYALRRAVGRAGSTPRPAGTS